MKIGIIADVHGNLPALEAVLDALEEAGCMKIICLGDVVGYGPFPAACIALIRDRRIACLKGNHDEGAADDLVPIGISELAQAALMWTRGALSLEDRNWLAELPPDLTYAGLHGIHACNTQRPRVWPYVRNAERLAANFRAQHHPICFNGHTHFPAIGIEQADGTARLGRAPEAYVIPPGARVLINPGSVGQPRDHDPRAACAIFEARDRSVRFLRVAYDLPRVLKALSETPLPPRLGERLALGQ